jgi:hypothetical protein
MDLLNDLVRVVTLSTKDRLDVVPVKSEKHVSMAVDVYMQSTTASTQSNSMQEKCRACHKEALT